MKIRQKLLLERLLHEESVSVALLAEEFCVSVKTVRNDLAGLDSFLKERLAQSCIRLEASEAAFIADAQQASRARASLRLDDFYLYKLSAEERVLLILSQLLAASDYLTIGELAEQLCVSRGTINTDLQAVRDWCGRHGVQVQFKKSRGIAMQESERRRRELCAQLVKEHRSISGIEDLSPEGGLYGRLFCGVNLSAIRDAILEAEERFDFALTDVAYEGLVVHIALSIKRDREQSEPPASPACPRESVQYRMADYIVTQLNEQLDAGLGRDSIGYITLHIFGRVDAAQGQEQLPYAQVIAERLVTAVSKRLAFNFQSDEKLYEALMMHICAAMARMKEHLLLSNPIKDTIISEYGDIYRAVSEESALLTGYTGSTTTDDELAYIVIHFASAMERERRLEQSRRIPAVIIVCGTGEGTARLVQDQVTRHFNLRVVQVVSAHRLSAVQDATDFIISTVPLESSLPVVLVSPIIRDADLAAVNRMIIELGFSSFALPGELGASGALAQRVQALVRRYGSKATEPQLLRELEKLVSEQPARIAAQKERTREYMLSELLREEYIVLNQTAEDWQQAVRLGGKQLLNNKVVEPEYIQAAIQNVKELGPYIVLTKGVAVPHAGAEYGVHSTAISLVSLREPVCFGNPDNDPVRYVFTLATTDSKSHLQALKDLVGLFDTPAFFETIDKAERPETVTAYIKAYEQAKRSGEEEIQ